MLQAMCERKETHIAQGNDKEVVSLVTRRVVSLQRELFAFMRSNIRLFNHSINH
jgi:hypothetical protein